MRLGTTTRAGAIASLFLVGSLEAQARPGSLLAAANDGTTNTSELIRVDTETGVAEHVAPVSGPIVSLAFNNYDGLMYAVYAVRVTDLPTRHLLVEIDPDTGDVFDVDFLEDADGVSYSVAGMAFSSDGKLYGIAQRPSRLLEIDPLTGAVTVVGSGLGVPMYTFGAAMLDDVLYVLSSARIGSKLYTVDLGTGLATLVGQPSIFAQGVGMSVDGDGRLVAIVNDTLYELDPLTGAATVIGSTGYSSIGGLGWLDDVDEACPCGADWKNHGEYVSCVDAAVAGLPPEEADPIRDEAASSDCGK